MDNNKTRNGEVEKNTQSTDLSTNLKKSDYEKGIKQEADDNSNISRPMTQKNEDKFIEQALVILSILVVIFTFPFSLPFVLFPVRQFERVVILRNGKLYKKHAFGPGIIFYLPCVDTVRFTDLRTIVYDVPPQEALTKDALTIAVDAVVFYKIYDPIAAVIKITNYKVSTQYLAATSLRNALGTRNLSEVLINRPAVSQQVFQLMRYATKDWGIQVVRVEIKNISLPLQLQKAMAAEAESTRLANAKIIVAQAEIESTKNLQKATEMLMTNPFCMQLRYLQSLQTIAGENTHTIVFPFSIDAVRSIFGK